MARKRRRGATGPMPMAMPVEYRPPSPAKRIRMSAEGAAYTAMEAHPKVQKMRNAIADAIESAIKKKMGPTRGGSVGEE